MKCVSCRTLMIGAALVMSVEMTVFADIPRRRVMTIRKWSFDRDVDGSWIPSYDRAQRLPRAKETEEFAPAFADALIAEARTNRLYGVELDLASQAVSKALADHLEGRGLRVVLVGGESLGDGGTEEKSLEGWAPSFLPKGKRFRLVWHDEFDGEKLDEHKWSFRTNFWGRPAHWFATSADNAVEVRDGTVRLKIKRRPDGQFISPQLQTGEILWDHLDESTTNSFWWIGPRKPAKFQHRYGYWECRCKLQRCRNWWSAFWMQSENIGTTLDASDSGAEIDIMESFVPGVIAPHNVFAHGYGADQIRYRTGGSQGRQLNDWVGWHTFGCLWTDKGYTFYVDGKEDGHIEDLVSHRPHFMLISTECKYFRDGRMTGGPADGLNEAVKAEDAFEVDYVRVWEESR